MKKKLLIAVFALSAIFAGATAFAACGGYNPHKTDAVPPAGGIEDSSAEIDSGKNEAVTPVESETVKPDNGGNDKNETSAPEGCTCCTHNMVYSSTLQATCTSIGYTLKVCSKCGYKDYVYTEAKGHDWDSGVVVISPTCAQKGLTLYSCKICRTVKSETVAKVYHDFVDGECKSCGRKYSQGLQFTLSEDGTYYILSGLGTCGDKEIVIPATHEGLPVKEIGRRVFYSNSFVESVIVPQGVTEIGGEAFYSCEIEHVELPNSIQMIASTSFMNAKIDYNEYEGGLYLGNESNPYFVMTGVKDKSLKTYKINADTKILFNAFDWCERLASIDIPEGVERLLYPFDYCHLLKNLVIPASVISIKGGLCQCINLTNLEVAEGNPVFHSVNNCVIDTEEKTLVWGCKGFEIPADGSVTAIGDYALYTIKNFTTLVIPESVTSIGDGAFRFCGLSNVTLPKNLTHIGVGAFGSCENLKSVTLPKGVTKIETQAFEGCKNLEEVILSEDTVEIVNGAFVGCINLKRMVIPDGVEYIDSFTFGYCRSLEEIVIPKSVKKIYRYAFKDCSDFVIVYEGTAEQWNEIFIDLYNEELESETVRVVFNNAEE